jgi:RHS repeat-associated protein
MFAATSGYRSDGDAGLMHVGARYYDAQVGRFITRDTYRSQKPYLYCEHDPVNAVDPTGHDWKRKIKRKRLIWTWLYNALITEYYYVWDPGYHGGRKDWDRVPLARLQVWGVLPKGTDQYADWTILPEHGEGDVTWPPKTGK